MQTLLGKANQKETGAGMLCSNKGEVNASSLRTQKIYSVVKKVKIILNAEDSRIMSYYYFLLSTLL